MTTAPFFYHPRMMEYDFGPRHPLRPQRLARTMQLLQAVATDIECLDPGLASRNEIERVHSSTYVDTVRALSHDEPTPEAAVVEAGFRGGDNPAFPGMFEAALAYSAGSVKAAEVVRDGAPLAFNMGGGLHHARRGQASGFCVFNDCAVACSILRDRFSRVAYVDIDLHHGDGVQWLFYDDPTVLTYSVHESGRYLYPGTGFVDETGIDHSAVNVPLDPMTTGDTWLWAIKETLPRVLDRFEPEAIVLQLGCDAHFLDPLGHLQVSVQEWLAAVELVRSFGLPTVALGGGGYEQTNVPRMWTGAVLTLLGREVPELQPETVDPLIAGRPFRDRSLPEPRWSGRASAEETVAALAKSP